MQFLAFQAHAGQGEWLCFDHVSKMFENRDVVWKIREITDFKHKIMYFEQWLVKHGVSLHLKN